MRTLAEIVHGRVRAPSTKPYRGNLNFVYDLASVSTKLDRNAKARILVAIEVLERKTKAHGRRNGVISVPGLIVLRCLLLRFHNSGTGLCCPSIETLKRMTGLCRQTIVNALKRLEASGVVIVTRRLVRVQQSCGAVVARQGSNCYAFREMSERIPLEIGPKSWRIPGVHRIGTNHTQAGNREGRLARTIGLSYAAISERRAKAGLR